MWLPGMVLPPPHNRPGLNYQFWAFTLDISIGSWPSFQGALLLILSSAVFSHPFWSACWLCASSRMILPSSRLSQLHFEPSSKIPAVWCFLCTFTFETSLGRQGYLFGVHYVHPLFISDMWSNRGSKAFFDNAVGGEGITWGLSCSSIHRIIE